MTTAAAGPLFRAGPRRALPRSCRPAQDETTGSYLQRLAAVNRITGAELISYLTATASGTIAGVGLDALAVVSGHPPLALAYALPELRAQQPGYRQMALRARTLPAAPNTVRPACRRCAARIGAERIDIWYRHEQNICRTHQLWTGPGAGQPGDQPDLATAPAIMHAHTRHLRLIRHHGRQLVHAAYQAARLAWNRATSRGRGMPHTIMRDLPLPVSFGHQDWPARPKDPVHAAASYPEVVNLTGLLAALRWQSAFTTADSYSRFLDGLHHLIPVTFPALGNPEHERLLMVTLNATLPPRLDPVHETADDT